ncbi:hypothetical protein [Streptomyces sp. JHA26]|uniref:hypothetical protein n=1 Tax=Streptomyces sp. JHA26 TaxID=1917143 RepID=UPI000989DABF|nr:hypothetical protein [Streptomyces sp. JHA26]
MRQLPTPHQVMRKGYAVVRSARSRLDSLVLVPPSPDDWPRVTAEHLSVLDGRTLNICVAVPDDVTAASASLVLGQGSSPVVVPLTLAQRSDGRVEAQGTTVVDLLEGDSSTGPLMPGGIRRYLLEAGQWRMSVVFTDVRGGESRYALAAAPKMMSDGPTLPESLRDDGTYCRIIASSTGRAYVSLGRDGADAEVVSVHIGWSEITLRGRLVNAPAEACNGDLELIRRNGKVSRTLPAVWEGDAFTCRVQIADFGTLSTKEQIWDVRLRRPRGRSLKLSRRRTDVRSPGDVFRMPHRLLTSDDGTALRINPYYTPIGSLAFRAALIPSGS